MLRIRWHFSTDPNPHLWLTDPDPDPAIFISDLQDASKNYWLITFWRHIYILFQRKKVIRKSQKVPGNQGFSYYFSLMIEGSRSGSAPLTNGSGSGSVPLTNRSEPLTNGSESATLLIILVTFIAVLRIRIRDPGLGPFWPLDPGSGIGLFRISDPGSRIPNSYFWELSDNFLDKKFHYSLKFGPNFVLEQFKN